MTGGNLVAQGISFFGGLILAKVLGASGRGDVAAIAVYNEASTRGFALGIPAAVGHHATRADERDRTHAEAQLLGAAARLSLLIAPVGALVAWLVFTFALGETSRPIRLLIVAAIVATPAFSTVPNSGRMILVARGQLRAVGVITVVQASSRAVLYGAFALAGGLTATSAGLILLGTEWAVAAVTLVVVGVRPRRGGSARPLMGYGMKTVPGSLATLTNSRLDQILMVPLLSSADLGIYAVAVGIAFVPINLGSTLGLSVFREAAADDATRRVTSMRMIQATRWIVAGTVVSCLAAYLLIVPVYGEEFSRSTWPAVLLIIGSGFAGCASVLVQIANACGRPSYGSWGSVSALVVTLVGLPIALPALGVVGAALVSLVAYSLTAVILFALVRRDGLVFVDPASVDDETGPHQPTGVGAGPVGDPGAPRTDPTGDGRSRGDLS